MIPSRFVFSQNFQILTSHGTFEKIVIKVQKYVRYRLFSAENLLKKKVAPVPHPWGTPCTTPKVKQATLIFVSSTNHHLG